MGSLQLQGYGSRYRVMGSQQLQGYGISAAAGLWGHCAAVRQLQGYGISAAAELWGQIRIGLWDLSSCRVMGSQQLQSYGSRYRVMGSLTY